MTIATTSARAAAVVALVAVAGLGLVTTAGLGIELQLAEGLGAAGDDVFGGARRLLGEGSTSEEEGGKEEGCEAHQRISRGLMRRA